MPVNRSTLVRSGIVVAVIAALSLGGWLAVALLGSDDKPRPPTNKVLKGFQTLEHPSSGFSIQYPRTWQEFEPQDPPREVPLVAGPGGDDFVLVRLCRLPEEIPPEAVPGLRPGFDSIIQRGGTNVLEQKQITLNRLPGFHYLYTFVDEASQQLGVHSHYFLVDKATVIQVVFQALPVDDFKALSSTFDRIANSFRALPRKGSVAPCASTPPPGQPAPAPGGEPGPAEQPPPEAPPAS